MLSEGRQVDKKVSRKWKWDYMSFMITRSVGSSDAWFQFSIRSGGQNYSAIQPLQVVPVSHYRSNRIYSILQHLFDLLPQPLIHSTNREYSGQFSGRLSTSPNHFREARVLLSFCFCVNERRKRLYPGIHALLLLLPLDFTWLSKNVHSSNDWTWWERQLQGRVAQDLMDLHLVAIKVGSYLSNYIVCRSLIQ